MPSADGLAPQLRRQLDVVPAPSETALFGDLGFLVDGNTCVGVSEDSWFAGVVFDPGLGLGEPWVDGLVRDLGLTLLAFGVTLHAAAE